MPAYQGTTQCPVLLYYLAYWLTMPTCRSRIKYKTGFPIKNVWTLPRQLQLTTAFLNRWSQMAIQTTQIDCLRREGKRCYKNAQHSTAQHHFRHIGRIIRLGLDDSFIHTCWKCPYEGLKLSVANGLSALFALIFNSRSDNFTPAQLKRSFKYFGRSELSFGITSTPEMWRIIKHEKKKGS